MDLSIRDMTLDDIAAIVSLEKASFDEPWSQEILRREMDNPQAAIMIATVSESGSEKAVGYINFWIVLDELQFHRILVDDKCRRMGIATQLMQAMMKRTVDNGITEATLEVHALNNSAIELYRKFGFSEIGVRPSYYSGCGGNALIMRADVNNN